MNPYSHCMSCTLFFDGKYYMDKCCFEAIYGQQSAYSSGICDNPLCLLQLGLIATELTNDENMLEVIIGDEE